MKRTRRETVRTFYDNLAKNYDQNRYGSSKQKKTDEYTKTIVLNLVGDVEHKTMLDCGCGTGRFADFFVQRGAKVIGLDISKNMAKIAKRKVPPAEFVIGDVVNTPFKESQFDIVVCSQVLTHLHEYKKPLLEMKRVIKDNGTIIIDIRNILWPLRPLQILKQKIERKNAYEPHYTHMGNIKKICTDIGLEIEEFRGTGLLLKIIKYHFTPTLILKIRKKHKQ
ncbi:MAG: hypothetical protein DRI01_03340 [Chloroflexi bacterium]|nr:MAG: hypothetical protein DRI01_03340 [Chloroflexota bacterium]